MRDKQNDLGSLESTVEFMGQMVDLDQISNPHLRKAVQRSSDNRFRFRYDDYSKTKWDEYNKQHQAKYYETVRPKYSEYSESQYMHLFGS